LPDLSLITLINICITLLLLVCSALISGSEVAFFSLTKSDLDEFKNSDHKKANKVVLLMQNPQKLLANILVANNTVNILAILVFNNLGDVLFGGFSAGFRLFTELVIMSFVLLVFGEVLPKVYANKKAKSFALLMAPVIELISRLFIVISLPLIKLSGFIEKYLRSSKSSFTVEDLSQALELTSKKETTAEQKNILEGIVNFGNTETVQIMKPRMDICAISNKTNFIDVLEIITQKGFSRNPVYGENIDEIIGVLYSKDLLPHIGKKNFNWLKLVKEPFFVPENKKLDVLLSDFQERKNHLAIVVDEYGGTSGIVSLEDVIEEIVGDINDEFDDDDLSYSKLDDCNFVFEGKINLKDFCKIINFDESTLDNDKGESETLAGLILELSGKFPRKNEKIRYHNLIFTIEAIEKKRVKQIKVTLQ